MGSGPVFVHSDPFRAARLVKAVRDRNVYLDSHIALLRNAAGDRALWIPTFNYDFPRTGVFDVRQSESQLGPLPERFRIAAAGWRTPIPIFSIAGIGRASQPRWGFMTDPFGADSIFADLVRSDGVVLYYGETFHYNTLVHYAERASGGPVYRYDKIFPGRVIMADGTSHDGSLNYHVRPMGTGLEYDWPRLLDEAVAAGVCRRLEGAPEILAASASQLNELWISDMKRDPFALLDSTTRQWAEPRVNALGRRFEVSDFETPEGQRVVGHAEVESGAAEGESGGGHTEMQRKA
jgi:aminoglycoside 3-N-acetyltransferase